MPVKNVLMFNSNGPQGWSETYYTSGTTILQAQQDAQQLVQVRMPLLGSEYHVESVRSSVVGQPGVSALRILRPNDQGNTALFDNDVAATCFQYIMTDGTYKVNRVLRGVPDEWSVWSGFVNRMVPTPAAYKAFSAFQGSLINLSFQWPHALKKTDAGNNVQAITGIAASATGTLIVSVGSTAGYGVINGSPLVLSGFRGIAGKLNGTYGPNAYAVLSATQLQLKIQVSQGQILVYTAGTAFARLSNAFTNFKIVTGMGLVNRILTRKVGRPFDGTRGRRSGRR